MNLRAAQERRRRHGGGAAGPKKRDSKLSLLQHVDIPQSGRTKVGNPSDWRFYGH
jgi:hypothetical protein